MAQEAFEAECAWISPRFTNGAPASPAHKSWSSSAFTLYVFCLHARRGQNAAQEAAFTNPEGSAQLEVAIRTYFSEQSAGFHLFPHRLFAGQLAQLSDYTCIHEYLLAYLRGCVRRQVCGGGRSFPNVSLAVARRLRIFDTPKR